MNFLDTIGEKGVEDAVNAAITIAEHWTKYDGLGSTIMKRLQVQDEWQTADPENPFNSLRVKTVNPWNDATRDFSWWQKNAVAEALTYFYYYHTIDGKEGFELKISREALTRVVGGAPLRCSFTIKKYSCTDTAGSIINSARLNDERFFIPLLSIKLGHGVAWKDVIQDLAATQEEDQMVARYLGFGPKIIRLLLYRVSLIHYLHPGEIPKRATSFANTSVEERGAGFGPGPMVWIHNEAYQYMELSQLADLDAQPLENWRGGYLIPCTRKTVDMLADSLQKILMLF